MLCTCHYVVLCHNDVTHSAAVAPMPLHADCGFLAQSISGENSTKRSICRSLCPDVFVCMVHENDVCLSVGFMSTLLYYCIVVCV